MSMEKVYEVMNGYINLSEIERQEFERQLRAYQSGRWEDKRLIEDRTRTEVRKIHLGPLGGGSCPCCGR